MQHHFIASSDGLKLHYSVSGQAKERLPVICLPGLSRPAADFDCLAAYLTRGAAGPARRVIQIDYRGRGLSQWDSNSANYSMAVEHGDLRSVLAAENITRAVFVGTSRGGLHTMLAASLLPDLVAGAVLNDIGPVIELDGLRRIAAYVGKFAPSSDWNACLDALKRTMGPSFPGLSEADFDAYMRLTFQEKDGRIVMRYDPALADSLKSFDMSQPIPPAWPAFDALKGRPLLILRGETSDLLSQQTVDAMMARHEGAEFFEVAGQGHAPLLLDEPSCMRIARFIASCP